MTRRVTTATRTARGGTLILGGGFAGSYVAKLVGSAGSTIVCRENFMLYTPLLPEAASGSIEPRHCVVPLRQMCRHAELLLGEIRTLDESRRRVVVSTESGELEIGYERLVIALGAVPRTFPVPGLAEHGMGFKDLADAIALRNHVLRRLEVAVAAPDAAAAATELGFVFVGAGYAGVEALAELNDLVHSALRLYPSLRDVPQRWVLVDAAPAILPEIPRRLGEYAARELAAPRRRDPHGHDARLLRREHCDPRRRDGGACPHARLDGRRAGRAPARPLRPAPRRSGPGRGRRDCSASAAGPTSGRSATAPPCRTRAHPGAFDPPTCQHALRQARRLARNLRSEPQPYGYRMLGQVATLGRYKGIADVLGLRLRGFPGWFVTRSYHLYQLPLLSRKFRVVVDWTVSLFFRRDTAELTLLGHPRSLGDD